MRLTLELARKGIGNVSPNPLVGSIIVKDGHIVGQGYHKRFGEAHAEVNAIRNAGNATHGATLYVNLEPCCHHGKTPPCTDAIIKAGIKRVVIGMVDPNPLVNSQGIDLLRARGIDVTTGIAVEECMQLNRFFIKYIKTGLPYVTIKIAQSIDGRIATCKGHSKWITSEETRRVVHRLRGEYDGVVIGAKTAIMDNPSLTVRHVSGVNPFRIVLDDQLSIPEECHLLSDEFPELTIIATASKDEHKKERIRKRGAKIWEIHAEANSHLSLHELLKKAAEEGLNSLLVEGGSEVFTSFLQERLADHIIIMISPRIIGEGIDAIGQLNTPWIDHSIRLIRTSVQSVGQDIVVHGDLQYP
ncbi:bifunctional diaminohydroxyphosphoribosylaminopyrimidine deaminase/5-amino-6-(5-phosphoribosylamino)uracil reductase RibD [candidate division KSB1 bacterium]|nr:bifunctional diaminohydroxyphosphoribosylaminopyrimidine deaminase/5-amino-6-(5-phosphoribosylamino)uracil reductase RibD [candidate division KSB1 bacterium]